MNKKHVLKSTLLAAFMLLFALNSCNKDEGPTALKLVSLAAGTIDLNGVAAPTDVPVNPTITATFNTNIDAATATSANIELIQNYDDASIELNISVSGKEITISPKEALGNGALYELTITDGLLSKDGEPLTELTRSFTTEGTFVPAGQVAYWNFENNANDQVGSYNASATVDISYVSSRNTVAGMAASFNGTTSIIEIPNGNQLDNTSDFTLAFWVKAISADHSQGHFVMGLGAYYGFQFEISSDYSSCKLAASYNVSDTATTTEDLWFAGNGSTKDNGGWQGWTYCKDLSNSGGVAALLQDKWAQVICTYNSSTKIGTMYINGEKMKEQDFNLWPDGDAKRAVTGLKYSGSEPDVYPTLALGFIQSREGSLWANESWGGYSYTTANHFKGLLDDVRIFHKALTSTEVGLLYNSEKP